MSELTEALQSSNPGAKIELYEIDLSPITGTSTALDHLYFHNGLDNGEVSLLWQGNTYVPWPIKGEGFEKTLRGAMPRPQLTAANVNGILTGLARDYEDLVGAKVIRRRTFAQFLDNGSDPDPNQHLPDEVYYIERKTQHDHLTMAWELCSVLDLEGVMLPGRVITATYCPWKYRGPECAYTGTNYFNVLDEPVATLAEDVCSKSVTGCKLRQGATSPITFGGFPASRTYKL